MLRLGGKAALTLTAAMLLSGQLARAQEAATCDYVLGDRVPLTESDLRNITDHVLARAPMLSSSPGIKFASAQRSVRSTDIASVIYYPHAENAGMKHAFQVGCMRQAPETRWTCEDPTIRRYMQLDSQTFEVRITASITSEEALALIAATRQALRATGKDESDIPQTAVIITPYNDEYHVSWGSADGQQDVTIQARLTEGGDPANPKDWRSHVFVPDSL